MKQKHLFRLFILILVFLFLGNGCWDRRELDSLALVQALGFDLSPSDKKKLNITVMIAIPSKLGGQSQGGGGGDTSPVLVVSKEAPSIYESFDLMNTSINRRITLLQNQVLIVGEAMAKLGVKRWIDNLVRFREMRRTMLIFVCKGQAAEIMKANPKLEKNPANYFVNMANFSKINGMVINTSLNEFINSFEAYAKEITAPVIAQTTIKTTEKDTQEAQASGKQPETQKETTISGTAVFKGDRLVGYLDNYETQVFQMVTDDFQEAMLTVSDPLKKNKFIIFRLTKGSPTTISYQHKDGKDHFLVKVNQEVDLISIQSGLNYTAPKLEQKLSKHIASQIKKRIEKVISKCQKKYRSDIFGFGVKVRNKMLTTQDWKNYHWPERFPDAKIKVNVKVSIRRVGVQFEPPELR